MQKKPEKNLKELFDQRHTRLGSIVTKVNLLQDLHHHFVHALNQLDNTIASKVRTSNYQNGCLILLCSNGGIATRLRYQIPALLSLLRQRGKFPGLTSIRYIVRPDEHQQETITKKTKPISMESAAMLFEIANTIQDKKLACALKKLAQRPVSMASPEKNKEWKSKAQNTWLKT